MEPLIKPSSENDLIRMCADLPYSPSSGFRGISYVVQSSTLAVVAYDNWTDNAVFMHCWSQATKPWFDSRYLHEIFTYPFQTCNRGLVIGLTQGDNVPIIEFCRRVGFKETYRIKDGFKLGTDLVIQEMRREDCRWLRSDLDGTRTESIQ